MDSWIQALLIITVPLDLIIAIAGAYFIRAYSHEQALIREAAHDAEITQREELRLQRELAKQGQYQPQGSDNDFIGQLIEQGAPLLLSKLNGGASALQDVNNNGVQKEVHKD